MNKCKEAYKKLDPGEQLCMAEVALNPAVFPWLVHLNNEILKQHMMLHSYKDPVDMARAAARLNAWFEFAEELKDMLKDIAQSYTERN